MRYALRSSMQPTSAVAVPEKQASREVVAGIDLCTRCKQPLCEKARERRFGGWQVLCLDCALQDLPGTD
jgi:hypothetical protein